MNINISKILASITIFVIVGCSSVPPHYAIEHESPIVKHQHSIVDAETKTTVISKPVSPTISQQDHNKNKVVYPYKARSVATITPVVIPVVVHDNIINDDGTTNADTMDTTNIIGVTENAEIGANTTQNGVEIYSPQLPSPDDAIDIDAALTIAKTGHRTQRSRTHKVRDNKSNQLTATKTGNTGKSILPEGEDSELKAARQSKDWQIKASKATRPKNLKTPKIGAELTDKQTQAKHSRIFKKGNKNDKGKEDLLVGDVPASANDPQTIVTAIKPNTSDNSPIKALLQQAEAQQKAGDLARAAATLERGLRIEARNPHLWNKLAHIRLEQGLFSQANTMAAKSNTLSGDYPALLKANQRIITEAKKRAGN